MFRVTQRTIGQRSLAGLQANLNKLGELQGQLSSGKAISKPSDDPAGTVTALQVRSEIRTNQQWSRNAQNGLDWLGTIDNALTGSQKAVNRIRDLTLQGMSTGNNDPQAREAMAKEVDVLRQHLVGVANTTYLGRPVFGGTTAGGQAYSDAGVFVGDTNAVERAVGASPQAGTADDAGHVRVNISGPAVFGGPPDGSASTPADPNLFDTLTKISVDLRGDPSLLSADLGAFDVHMKSIQGALSEMGARTNRLEQMQQTADDRVISLQSSLSNVENIDLPRTIVDMQMQQVAYQAALGATAKVVQPSLLDFLH